MALPSQLKAQRNECDPEGGKRHKGLNQHFLAQVKHWQVQASLSLVHLGHQTLEEDSAAVSGPGSTVPSRGPGGSIPICCLIFECPDTVHNSARGAVGQAAQEDITWLPDFMSFMFMAFFMPLPFSFLFFFFLQQHFLQMQKQQVRMRSPATTAMAIRAQGGTVGKSQGRGQPCSSLSATQKPCSTGCTGTSGGHQEGNTWERSYSRGILLSSFMNLSLSLVNMSSLLSPGPAASVEFSIVLMGSVLAVASGAIMDACLNVMVGQGLPETHHLGGHTGPCCPHSSPMSPGQRLCGQQGCTRTPHPLLEGHRPNV